MRQIRQADDQRGKAEDDGDRKTDRHQVELRRDVRPRTLSAMLAISSATTTGKDNSTPEEKITPPALAILSQLALAMMSALIGSSAKLAERRDDHQVPVDRQEDGATPASPGIRR